MAELNPDLAKILEGVEGAEALSSEIIEALNAGAEARPTGGADVATLEPETVTEAVEATETGEGGENIMTIATDDVVKSAETESEDEGTSELAKQLDDIRTELAKERQARETVELVEKVKTELPALVVDAEDVASVMFRIKKGITTEDDFNKVLDILKAASRAVREAGTFDERGTTRDNDEGTPIGKMVADIMREDSSLTKQQAIAKALATEEGRRLYNEAHA